MSSETHIVGDVYYDFTDEAFMQLRAIDSSGYHFGGSSPWRGDAKTTERMGEVLQHWEIRHRLVKVDDQNISTYARYHAWTYGDDGMSWHAKGFDCGSRRCR